MWAPSSWGLELYYLMNKIQINNLLSRVDPTDFRWTFSTGRTIIIHLEPYNNGSGSSGSESGEWMFDVLINSPKTGGVTLI